jgi:hypothetical protein
MKNWVFSTKSRRSAAAFSWLSTVPGVACAMLIAEPIVTLKINTNPIFFMHVTLCLGHHNPERYGRNSSAIAISFQFAATAFVSVLVLFVFLAAQEGLPLTSETAIAKIKSETCSFLIVVPL